MQPADLERLRQALPELPPSRRRRFIEDLGLPDADAAVLTNERTIADIYTFPNPTSLRCGCSRLTSSG